jgi:hypothetical protein
VDGATRAIPGGVGVHLSQQREVEEAWNQWKLYPLVNIQKTSKNYGTPPSFMSKSTFYMAMFNSYISFRNGHVQQQTGSFPEGDHR